MPAHRLPCYVCPASAYPQGSPVRELTSYLMNLFCSEKFEGLSGRISRTEMSFTFVPVGPVRIRPPMASRAW